MTMENPVDEVSGEADKFPVGLRVLVVDDDRCCLKLLETMLEKCKFNVTTTREPMEALKMLREDKNRFEIVITDVNMPGMDGFKLLELIGLEMDLPVIMLSAHSETNYIMKGVQHGACDYLVKPCRMLQLQNIWMHVFKRRHMNQKDKNKNSPNQDDEQLLAQPENPETCDDSKAAGQKKKDRNEEDKNGKIETEDPVTTQKKPRVIWESELKQKFLAAIDHLTIEKAVPKKILKLMNVEGLTRENVASHLQKYRNGLKRMAAKNEQENSMQFLTIPRVIQQNTSQNAHNFFYLPEKLPQSQLPELFKRNPRSLEVDTINNLSDFSYPTTSFPNNRVGSSSSINPGPRLSHNHLLLQGNHHAPGAAPSKSESFGIGTSVASNLLGHDQSKRDWQQDVHLFKFRQAGVGSFQIQYHHEVPLNNSRLSPVRLPSTNEVQNPQPNFLVDVPCQEDQMGSDIQTGNRSQNPNWQEHRPVFGHNSNHSAMNPLPLANEIMGHNMATIDIQDISRLISQSSDSMGPFGQLNAVDANNFLNTAQDDDGFDFDALEEIVNADDKHEPDDSMTLMDGVFWSRC